MTRPKPPWLILALLLATVLLAPAAAGHAYLSSATPPPGGSVAEGTSVLALRFTEELDRSELDVELVGPDGSLQPARAEVPSSRPTEVRIETEPLAPGAYELAWRVLSVDGHVEEGSMGFTVGAGQAEGAGLQDASGAPPSLLDLLEGLARTLLWGGVLAAVGLPLFLSEVQRPSSVPSRIPSTLALLLVGSLLGITALLWLLQASLETGWIDTARTRPGALLLVQAALVAGALAAVLQAARQAPSQRQTPLLIAVLPASLAVVVNSMGGHGVVALASREAVAGHIAATVHVLVTGLWAGGVLAFLLLRDLDGPSLAELIERFFAVGVISVIVLAATGLYQAYVHLPRPADLWESPYGWILLAKTGLLAVLIGFGAMHDRWLGPRLARGAEEVGRFRRVIASEITVLATVVVLAGVLAAAPLPSAPLDEGPGPRAVFEEERATEDFWVRIAFDQASLQASEPHELTIELRARTSLSTEEVDMALELSSPGPNGSERTVQGDRMDPSTWIAREVSFDEPGDWTLSVALRTPAGLQSVRFSLPVAEAV